MTYPSWISEIRTNDEQEAWNQHCLAAWEREAEQNRAELRIQYAQLLEELGGKVRICPNCKENTLNLQGTCLRVECGYDAACPECGYEVTWDGCTNPGCDFAWEDPSDYPDDMGISILDFM